MKSAGNGATVTGLEIGNRSAHASLPSMRIIGPVHLTSNAGSDPMTCCSHCVDAGSLFSRRIARWELRSYRKRGCRRTTQLLLSDIRSLGIEDKTFLDIGSGIGAIPHELLACGASSGAIVEASPAYLEASRAEAGRRGELDRLTYYHDDFVDLAGQLPPADIVTLDRVICCYPDVERLVGSSVAKAKYAYGVVYPRERWLTRIGIALGNAVLRLRGGTFRTYLYPGSVVDAIVREHGFRRYSRNLTVLWQVVTYVRELPEARA
jgi:magnesium-protoporphyrin O-methyltransferase